MTGFLSGKMWAGALAAAALVTIVVVMAPRRNAGAGDARGGPSIQILDAADTSAPATVRWTGPAGVFQYQVLLKDDAGAIVFAVVTKANEARIPDEVTVKLAPGRRYTWTVTALDAKAEPLDHATKTFSAAPH